MKVSRTFRMDQDISSRLDKQCNRHGDVTWHLERALDAYLPKIQAPVLPTPLAQEVIEHLFDIFWSSGIRKVNKKKAKSLFTSILKKTTDQGWSEFTEILVEDIKSRLRAGQLGFDQMHPTTYLNGERWNDEVINNENNQRPSQQRSSAVSRVREAGEKRLAEIEAQESEYQALVSPNGDIRAPDRIAVRGCNAAELGGFIEGSYDESDC